MKDNQDEELRKMVEESKTKKAVKEACKADSKMNLEVKRYLMDADIPMMQRFLFKAMAMQTSRPEAACFIDKDRLDEVEMLYDLLTVLDDAKKALML